MWIVLAYVATYGLLAVILLAWLGAALAGALARRLRITAWVRRASLLYLGLLVILFGVQLPWRQSPRHQNRDALVVPYAWRPGEPAWTSRRMAARLAQTDTLVAVSISGGGSRAAYFAAAVLERLSVIRVPVDGRSLIHHIDLISSVSGGSVAAAYFTAHIPPLGASDAERQAFFRRFKVAMAQDFELPIAWHILNPAHTLTFLTLRRNAAEVLAQVFDRKLFNGQPLRYRTLLERERAGVAPLLILNASVLSTGEIFAFTKDPVRSMFPVRQRPDPSLGTVPGSFVGERYLDRHVQTFEDSRYGPLEALLVSAAISASAAYPPFFGAIRIRKRGDIDNPIVHLGDGGLVDNSGLISLYTHLFQRDLFTLSAGRLKRVVIIAIDAAPGRREYRGLGAPLAALFDLSQEQTQRYVLPEVLRLMTQEELADKLDEPEWREFRIPAPIVIPYALCAKGPPVPTSFRLSAMERGRVEASAAECVNEYAIRRITNALAAHPERELPVYEGIIGPADRFAYRTLYEFAKSQQVWSRGHGRYATVGELTKDDPLDPTRTGYVFEARIRDGRLLMYATPSPYRKPGRVSLVFETTEELARLDSLRFCLRVFRHIHGGDKGGRPAAVTDPVFIPYGIRLIGFCI